MILSSKPQDAALPPAVPPSDEVTMDHSFWKHKFDNLLLFCALCLMSGMLVHFVHHPGDGSVVAWAETTFTTILGAFIGLTQAARLLSKPNGNGNGAPK